MALGLRGPAGGPSKSEDITGWGLNKLLTKLLIKIHIFLVHMVNKVEITP